MDAGLFLGRADYVNALREAVLLACAEGARDIYLFDERFVDWPLSEPAVLAALTGWARGASGARRLHLLAAHYEDLRRRHPRFVQWRGQWGHCVDARAYEPDALAGAGRPALAAALLALGGERPISVRLFDAEQARGAVSFTPADALRTKEWFDALTQRSCESFASSTLGL